MRTRGSRRLPAAPVPLRGGREGGPVGAGPLPARRGRAGEGGLRPAKAAPPGRPLTQQGCDCWLQIPWPTHPALAPGKLLPPGPSGLQLWILAQGVKGVSPSAPSPADLPKEGPSDLSPWVLGRAADGWG